LGLLLLGTCLVCPPASADPIKLRDLKQKAEAFEQQGNWEKACDCYEGVLRLQRDLPNVRQRYIHCVRRLWQTRRHNDASYQREVLSLEYGQAVHLYTVLRDLLLDHSLDRKKLSPAKLFRRGLEELDYALTDIDGFCRQHIRPENIVKVGEFRSIMLRTWSDFNAPSRKEALKQIRDIALAAEGFLGLNSTVTIMEFTCGACYALDEYTVYLTPIQLRELCNSLRGETVGIGVGVAAEANKVFIQQVEPGSPAARAALGVDDQILSIDKKAVGMLTPEAVAALLEGPPGSMIEIELLSAAMGMRTVQLRREAVLTPSVDSGMLPGSSTGLLRITAFQETTVKEVDEALARLTESGMKALILDLRGNSGGLFESAVEVARRFLPTGIIATKQHLDEKSKIVTTLCEAKNPSALTLPLVVLTSNETASAAEVLAGALKENNRATLVGEATYGKGCTQFLLKLPDLKGGIAAGGMRLTVAKVFSPKGLSYTGRGISPDISVDRDVMTHQSIFDPQLEAAQLESQRQLAMGPR
jgi:carboxyl-terminal processing protease